MNDRSLIVEELGEDTDPEVLDRCGAFFLDNGEYDKAVKLYLSGSHYEKVCFSNAGAVRFGKSL